MSWGVMRYDVMILCYSVPVASSEVPGLVLHGHSMQAAMRLLLAMSESTTALAQDRSRLLRLSLDVVQFDYPFHYVVLTLSQRL